MSDQLVKVISPGPGPERNDSQWNQGGTQIVTQEPSFQNQTVGQQYNPTQISELSVRISQLPSVASTKDVWEGFHGFGELDAITLLQDRAGRPSGKAIIWFRPPPRIAFWESEKHLLKIEELNDIVTVRVALETRKAPRAYPSSNPGINYPETMKLYADYLDLGFMYDRGTMMYMYRAIPRSAAGIRLSLSMLHRNIEIDFQVVLRHPQKDGRERTQAYTSAIPLRQQIMIKQEIEDYKLILLLTVEAPPRVYTEYDGAKTHQKCSVRWNRRNNSMFRQTSIIYDTRLLRKEPATLKKSPFVEFDIGRCTTYRLVFDTRKNNAGMYDLMCKALRDMNVEISTSPVIHHVPYRNPVILDSLDEVNRGNGSAMEYLVERESLDFPVRYQLEVCISEGLLNEQNLTEEFVKELRAMDTEKATDLLEYVSSCKKRRFDPMEIFMCQPTPGSGSCKIPTYCALIRTVIITPTTMYLTSPTMEISNRVIRRYAEHADRFLRVRFTDEKLYGELWQTDGETMNEVYNRVRRTLANGIVIGDRHFQYLASGNSQFREHGAFFFSPSEHLQTSQIRAWMGTFSHIKVVAKYAARLGQCFSTTRAIHGANIQLRELPDVYANNDPRKSCFTDGVGKISKFLAQIVAVEIGVPMPTGEPPSVFQFRLGGFKGVLAVSPDAKGREIHMRKSQSKFSAVHEGLEIVRCSQFASAFLNRQLIMIFSTLGVPDDVFLQKMRVQLSNIALAMENEKMALTLLQKEIDFNQMTLTLAAMVLDGFQAMREPFMISLLRLWRAWTIKYLKEKARLVIPDGACLLGCVDETQTLKGHFNHLQYFKNRDSMAERSKSLPEIFIQLSHGPEDRPWVILGTMVLARNPSLHPGDVRVVRGVDVPALHHLKDVVVLPQTGDIALSTMCSGGDLDGDDYVVIWDKDLIPPEWNHSPMNYDAPQPTEVETVTMNHVIDFFIDYMKNNSLPSIANAHLANADSEIGEAKSYKCIKLAELHSKAVDYAKTGESAVMLPELRPRRWPHFMDKVHLSQEKTYLSYKILGQLYDLVQRVDFSPAYEYQFDRRILEAYYIDEKTLSEAREIKLLYDEALVRIMTQHAIKTEFEVWSTFVLQHAKKGNDFKYHEEIGGISKALKERFRDLCIAKAGGKNFDLLGIFVAAMYTVTKDELSQALDFHGRTELNNGSNFLETNTFPKGMPLISFPWLFHSELGKIARRLNGAPIVILNVSDLPQRVAVNKYPKKPHMPVDATSIENDILETEDGLVRLGQIIPLFPDNLTTQRLRVNSDCSSQSSNQGVLLPTKDSREEDSQYQPKPSSPFSNISSEGKMVSIENVSPVPWFDSGVDTIWQRELEGKSANYQMSLPTPTSTLHSGPMTPDLNPASNGSSNVEIFDGLLSSQMLPQESFVDIRLDSIILNKLENSSNTFPKKGTEKGIDLDEEPERVLLSISTLATPLEKLLKFYEKEDSDDAEH